MINEISKIPIFLNKSKEADNLPEVPGSGEKPAESAGTDRRDIVDVSSPRPGAGELGEKTPIPVNDEKSKVAADDNRGGNKPLNAAEEKLSASPPKDQQERQIADKAARIESEAREERIREGRDEKEENKSGDIPSKGMESHAEADKAIEAVKNDFVRTETVASAYGQKASEIGKALDKVV